MAIKGKDSTSSSVFELQELFVSKLIIFPLLFENFMSLYCFTIVKKTTDIRNKNIKQNAEYGSIHREICF